MARKAAWEELADDDLGPYRKARGWSFGRVLTGLLVVGAGTFVGAYYFPLYRAHQKLDQQYRELAARDRTVSDQASNAERALKSAVEQRDRLQAAQDQRDSLATTDAGKLERARGAVSRSLDKFVKKGNATVVAKSGVVLVAFDAALLFLPQRLDLAPVSHSLLCDTLKNSEANTVRVHSSLGDAWTAPSALAKIFPNVWSFSAARSAAVAQMLEGGCAFSATRISAIGDGKRDPWAAEFGGSAVPADRIELELSMR